MKKVIAKKDSLVNVDWSGRMEVYSSSDYLPVRALAHRVKDGDKEGIGKAAGIMAGLVKAIPEYEKGVLVPMPGRSGVALYTRTLADEIATLTGLEVSDLLRGNPHQPLYEKKVKDGINSLHPFDFEVKGQIPDGKFPILVDNVLDTGTTAMSAFRALGDSTKLVVLGSTVNYRLYNYPVNINMVNDQTDDKKDLEQLKEELKTAIDDVLFIGGTGAYDRGTVKDTRMSHEKTLTGTLTEKVPISVGAYVESIGYTKQLPGQTPKAMLRTNVNGILVENMQNVEDVDAVLNTVRKSFYNSHGNVLSTFGRHRFMVGESFQMHDESYEVLDVGSFSSLLKPFGAQGIRVADSSGKKHTMLVDSHFTTRIYVQPHSERLHDAMLRTYGKDVRGDIKEALDKAMETEKTNSKSIDMEKEKNEAEQTAKENQKKAEAAKQEAKKQEEERKKAEEQKAKEEAKDEPKFKVAGAVAQALLLSAVLEQAKANNGVWLNKSEKKAPAVYGETTQLSPYNNLLLSAHSEFHDFKTSQYTSFEKAKNQGISVKQGEDGVPLSWIKWESYVNKYDKTDVKSREGLMAVAPEERSNYKAVPHKEYRYMFNVEQTVLPEKEKAEFSKLVDLYGSQQTGKIISMSQESLDSLIATTYKNMKEKHPDALLLFRNRDFYQMYNEDAQKGGSKLGLSVTNQTNLRGIDFLASFPHQALDVNLPKLVRAGFRVAILDQPVEDKVRTTRIQLSEQEKAADEQMKGIVAQLTKSLVPIKTASAIEHTHYDAAEDSIHLASAETYETYTDYAHDLATSIIAATGSEKRLDRAGRIGHDADYAEKHEQLIQELSAGAILSGLGLKARLSEKNVGNVDYWVRELKEDPKLIEFVERDVTNALETIDKLTRGETVEYGRIRGDKPKSVEMPNNYSIARELAKLPDAERKEFVVVTDKEKKTAAVILPAGASLEVNNEIPGMNKSRIAYALKKEGIDEDGITFHNAGGALGLRQPNAFFEGKEVMVNRLKQYALIPMTRLDVSALVIQKADIEKVNIFPDEDNNYAIYVKARNEKAITMYPAKEDITLYFNSLKDPAGNKVRNEIGQKYYQLAKEHPELKKDLLTIDTGNIDLKRIGKVSLFKPNNSSRQVMMSATIDGEKQPAREVSIGAWNRFWLADDQDKYKTQLATKVFGNVLDKEHKEQKEEKVNAGQEVQRTPGFHY